MYYACHHTQGKHKLNCPKKRSRDFNCPQSFTYQHFKPRPEVPEI